MELTKHITDEKTGIGYILCEDYYLPDIDLPCKAERPIDIWERRHKQYLKEKHRVVYYNLLTTGKLNSYLANLNEEAEDMFLRLVKQLAEKEKVTEELKADDCMKWVRLMNNVRAHAQEIVNSEIIFTG